MKKVLGVFVSLILIIAILIPYTVNQENNKI